MLAHPAKEMQGTTQFGVPELLELLQVACHKVLEENHRLRSSTTQQTCGTIGEPESGSAGAARQSALPRLAQPCVENEYFGPSMSPMPYPRPKNIDDMALGVQFVSESEQNDEEAQELETTKLDEALHPETPRGANGLRTAGRPKDGTDDQLISLSGSEQHGEETQEVESTKLDVALHLETSRVASAKTLSLRRAARPRDRILKDISQQQDLASDAAWHVGLWVDMSERFYGGGQICIGHREWVPNSSSYEPTCAYVVQKGLRDSDVSLSEFRADGSFCSFKATKSKDDMIVVPENSSEDYFVLRRWTPDCLQGRSKIHRDFSSNSRQLRAMMHSFVEDESQLSTTERCRRMLRRMVRSRGWGYFIGSIIVINSICLGIQAEMGLPNGQGASEILDWMEHAFLCIYVLECCLNLAAGGLAVLKDPWFQFDLALVFLGISYELCLRHVVDSNASFMQQILVLRTLRLLRLLRAMRMLPIFQTGWQLTYGLLTSLHTMLSTLALVILFLYAFSCLGIECITKNEAIRSEPDLSEIVDVNFPNVFVTMVTLLQFVTLDSVAAVYNPLVVSQPLLVLYFLPIILIVSISLMNMVTAVLVDGAIFHSENDREAKRQMLLQKAKSEVPVYRALFRQLDTNNSQSISIEEIISLDPQNMPRTFQEALASFQFESIVEFFEMLDVDQSGDISEDEFIDGLLNLSMSEVNAVSPEIYILLKLSRSITKRTKEMTAKLSGVHQDVRLLWTELQQLAPAEPHLSPPSSAVCNRVPAVCNRVPA